MFEMVYLSPKRRKLAVVTYLTYLRAQNDLSQNRKKWQETAIVTYLTYLHYLFSLSCYKCVFGSLPPPLTPFLLLPLK
jgi:hypothetical protein